jgi:two-component system, sensor histidine kinase and response regulator
VTIRFAIRDTGIGIPEAQHTALFNPFAQADSSTTRKYGGTGLGLTISTRLVEGMKGKINLESAAGQGSMFSFNALFDLPLSFPTGNSKSLGLAGRCVLIVDNNATSCAVLATATRSWGMVAHVATTSDEALTALRSRSDGLTPFDVVLLDGQVRGFDGNTLQRTIELDSKLAKTLLIIVGAIRNSESLSAPTEHNWDLWLSKPIKPSVLHAMLLAKIAAQTPPLENLSLEVTSTDQSETGYAIDAGSAARKRILVVDDNLFNRKVAQKQLERLGYLVDAVDGGKSALAAMSTVHYDVVMMDCEMAGMDGYATAAEIRRRENFSSGTIIIAMTAHALEGARELCLKAGMDEYVAKPLTLQSLTDVLGIAFRPHNRV